MYQNNRLIDQFQLSLLIFQNLIKDKYIYLNFKEERSQGQQNNLSSNYFMFLIINSKKTIFNGGTKIHLLLFCVTNEFGINQYFMGL